MARKGRGLMNERLFNAIAFIVVVAISAAAMFGLYKFLVWSDADRTTRQTANCARIAEVGEIKEWRLGDNGTCYMLKDGKIMEIK
jgi:hypothetical protein